jgi:hypothetical protein
MSASAKWRKVVVSGSIAELNTLSVDNNVSITGSLLASSSVFLQGLTNSNQPSIVSIDPTTGQLYYQGTGSFTADSASYAMTASHVNPLNQNVVITGSLNATNDITASIVAATNNGNGTNFKVGDDVWIGDVNISNTMQVAGIQSSGSGFIKFGSGSNSPIVGGDGADGVFQVTGSLNVSGSITAVLTQQSSSYLVGYDPTTGNMYYEGTGSVVSVTASYALSASQAATASYVNTLNQAVIISGSLAISTTTGNSLDINADTFIFTGSISTTGSVAFKGLTQLSASYVVGYDPTTGLLTYEGTGSAANSASYAVSSSYAVSASYANDATSASYALSSSYAESASYAVSASYANDATSASYALSASYAVSSSYANDATSASYALSSSYAVSASYANDATSASYALSSSYAESSSYANDATSASYALSSSYAESASYAATGNGTFSGSFSGSFSGDGSKITGVSASVLQNALTGSTGITAFTFDGSAPAQVQVSGSTTLSSGSVTKWTGDAFANSSITDLGNVTINNAGGVLIQAGGLYVTGASTFHDNVVMQGDLTVFGTASFQNSENLAVADQFILLNSGSTTFQDSGLIINTGNSGNSGSAFFLETAATTTGSPLNGRFAVAGGVLPDASSVTAEEYMNTTVINAANPSDSTPPAFGGSVTGQGNMWVNTATSDIWIYA